MQALAGVADERGQAPLDVEVHVLEIGRPREFAARDLAADLRHAALDGGEVGGGEDADGGEHPRVRERALDVDVGQAAIEIDRRRVALDELGDRLAEAARPAGLGASSGGVESAMAGGSRANGP